MTLKYDKLLKHIREKDGEVRSFLDEAELETAVGNYVGELVFVEPDKIFVRDGINWNLVGGSGNPFDYLQLKTDYTPTGLEPVGTSYWNTDRIRTITTGGAKDIAFTTDLASYLKLDQTTPQTTVGRFAFPNIAVNTNLIYTDSANGRVGIGTITPAVKLTIQQGANSYAQIPVANTFDFALGIAVTTDLISGMDFKNFSSVGQVRLMARDNRDDYIVMNTFGSTAAGTIFGVNRTNTHAIFGQGTTDTTKKLSIGTFNAGDLILGTNNTERIRILSTGNVGIGTTSPATRLQVTGHLATDIVTSDMGFDYKPVPAPSTAPTLALTTGTQLNIGQYWYTVTYYTAIGETSKSTSTAITTTAGNQSVIVTFPIATNPAVIGRKIYRTLVGSTNDTGSLIATIANNTATTYTDVTTDASLSADRWIGYKPNTTSKGIALNGVRALVIDPNFTSLGSNAGISATSPGFGTFIGSQAGRFVTYGFGDTLIGYQAGYSATTAGDATMVGVRSGFYLTTGANNVGVGSNALQGVTTGANNTALGFQALLGGAARITGASNTGVGTNTIAALTTGAGNNALGASALAGLSTGSYNNSIGVGSLQAQTTGSYNIALGYTAGRYITGGSVGNTISTESIFIGYNTRALADNQTNEIVIGSQVTGTGSNTVIIGNASITQTTLRGLVLTPSLIAGSVTNNASISATGRLSYVGSARKQWTKYTADTVTLTNGTSANTVADLRTMTDGLYYNVQEAASTPGINLIVDFISVTAFEKCRVLAQYEGTATHAIALQLYNWTTSAWDTFNSLENGVADITTAGGIILHNYEFTCYDDTNYIGTSANLGKVRVRFYHTMAGNASHDLHIDEVSLRQ